MATREGMSVNTSVNKGIVIGKHKLCGSQLNLKLHGEKRKHMLEELFYIKFWIT